MLGIREALLFLTVVVVAVPLFKRLGLGSVLGYLVAGALIGPHGLRLVPDVEEVAHLAELGVVLLLFLIGLELQPRRLWELRSRVFGVGGAQVGPPVNPGLPAIQRREHASLGGAPHLRRRHPGGVGRLLELGRQAHLVLAGPVERHLHRPAAIRGVQPPHKSLLSPGDRPVR